MASEKKTGLRKLERVNHQRKKTGVVESRLENGGFQNTSSGYTVGTEKLQKKAGATKEKLNKHHHQLKDMETTWDEGEELATGRAEFRKRVLRHVSYCEFDAYDGELLVLSTTETHGNCMDGRPHITSAQGYIFFV